MALPFVSSIKLAFVGDICPGGVLHGSSNKPIADDVLNYLNRFDLRIGTLESAIGDTYSFDDAKVGTSNNIIYSKDDDIRRLKELCIDIVSLANNHSTDLGLDGLIHTMELLKSHNILYVGAGKNINDAEAPVVVSLKGKKVAFLAFYDTLVAPHPASNELPGVCTSRNLFENIIYSKKQYDYVFVLPHWGFEFIFRPLPKDKNFAHKIINCGADGIIGSHTHQIQPHIYYRNRPIFFSLGNFLFPDFFQQPPGPIWYPDITVSLNHILPVSTYNCNLETYVKFVWKHQYRIGMIAELHISDTIYSCHRLVYLNDDNVIDFLPNSFKYNLILTTLGVFVCSPVYRLFYFLSEVFFFIKRRVRL